ncbi:isochorismatase family protein [Conexibacter woesei]|uniref:isochorismatase family protein n=1 Tax=Conexibacter woesei TaxID=191495 RepID=UPI000411DA7B|nr:isochorismatase family protein [Conexibacter woesei]
MPVTQLDPQTALVVIDLQTGIVGMDGLAPNSAADVIARSAELIGAFRARDLPVVLVNVNAQPPGRTEIPPRFQGEIPEEWTRLVGELDVQPSDILVTKRSRGAFATTDLEQQLRDRGVTQIVLTGISTSAGVESTAREAHERGLNVTLATDATTDSSADAYAYSLANTYPKISETGTTAEILALLPPA